VLRDLVSRLDIMAARAEPERRVRRAIVFAPRHGGEIIADRRTPHPQGGQTPSGLVEGSAA
jgi:hypothetical protein